MKAKKKNSQKLLLIEHFTAGMTITRIEALRKYGIAELPTRIWELKNELGFDIDSSWVKRNGKRFKSYYIKKYSKEAS